MSFSRGATSFARCARSFACGVKAFASRLSSPMLKTIGGGRSAGNPGACNTLACLLPPLCLPGGLAGGFSVAAFSVKN